MMTNYTTDERGKQPDVRKELAAQKREMQIQLICQNHPVYEMFNFSKCTDSKVAEMYHILVEKQEKNGQKQSD